MDGWKPENCMHDDSPLEGSLYLLQVCDENNSHRFYIFVLTVLNFINAHIWTTCEKSCKAGLKYNLETFYRVIIFIIPLFIF